MKKIILATRNRGKIEEMRTLLAGLPVEVISLRERPDLPAVEEDGDSFAGNALKKAVAAARAGGELALADDSGLEVEALGGLPGVRSARFAGPGAGDRANNMLLLQKLEGVPPERRGARFRCAVAVARPEGETHLIEETCAGRIAEAPRGQNGFGYDPLFVYEPAGLTFAEMEPAEKNRVSHRGKALCRARLLLERLLRE